MSLNVFYNHRVLPIDLVVSSWLIPLSLLPIDLVISSWLIPSSLLHQDVKAHHHGRTNGQTDGGNDNTLRQNLPKGKNNRALKSPKIHFL